MNWLSRLFGRRSDATVSGAPIFFTNTLTGKKDVFSPLRAGVATLYSCGPTVYSRAQIGNLRAYVFADTIARVLTNADYHVRRVINITDVGHLQSDADEGEDKMEVGAKREGLTAQQVAERYTKLFLEDLTLLNIDRSAVLFPKATEYIREQIEMITQLEAKGFTYRTHDGIYFDTAKFPGYGKLGGGVEASTKEYALADIGRRIKDNPEKRQPADFALWRFSPEEGERQQEWPSPWGVGFPGWHIECSAMTKALLGEQIDIHTGGMDHIPVHHNNEIAQSEGVSGKQFVRYWIHEAFLTIEGAKISKSLGNDIYLSEFADRGLDPLALRYFFLQAHYRSPISFSWEAVTAANEALHRLWRLAREVAEDAKGRSLPSPKSRQLIALLRDDLGTPAALALLWESLKSEELGAAQKLGVLEAADAVLGLKLITPPAPPASVATLDLPQEVQLLILKRDEARAAKQYAVSDELRKELENRGYRVDDTASGTVVTPTTR